MNGEEAISNCAGEIKREIYDTVQEAMRIIGDGLGILGQLQAKYDAKVTGGCTMCTGDGIHITDTKYDWSEFINELESKR